MVFRKGFRALGALIHFLDRLIIDEIIRKVDAMETKGKIVNELEVFVLTAITQEIFLEFLHPTSS
jgi:hypothetical protein